MWGVYVQFILSIVQTITYQYSLVDDSCSARLDSLQAHLSRCIRLDSLESTIFRVACCALVVCRHGQHLQSCSCSSTTTFCKCVFSKLVCSELCEFRAACICKCIARVFLEEIRKNMNLVRSAAVKERARSSVRRAPLDKWQPVAAFARGTKISCTMLDFTSLRPRRE